MLEFFRKTLRLGSSGLPSESTTSRVERVERPPDARRASNGLKHFLETIPRSRALEVLDLGGLSEANIEFLGKYGGRMHAVDLLECFDQAKRAESGAAFDARRSRDFVDEYLNFSRNQFDAVLVWDSLEYLDSDLLYSAVERISEAVRPGGGLLTFFHTAARGETVDVYRYRIESASTLSLSFRQRRALPHSFNNRALERLFGGFSSVKFFLTRDNLREVIAVR